MKKTDKEKNINKLRSKAEDLHAKRQEDEDAKLSEADMKKLIHSLEVHQIELELQNEELILARSEAKNAADKYSELYDFAPNGYFTLTKDGKILELNLTGAKLLGKERSHIKNSQFGFFLFNGSKPIFSLFLEKIFQSLTKVESDIICLNNNSAPFYIYLTGIVSEKRDKCFVTAVDITKRILAERELAKSNKRFESLVELLPEAVFEIDMNLNLSYVNQRALELFGYSQEEISAGLNALDVIVPDQRELAKSNFAKRLRGEEPGRIEYQAIKKDGSSFPILYHASSIIEEDGLLGARGIIVDITDRKKNENALIESEERFNLAMKASNDGLFDWNLETNEIYYSPAWKKMLGYKDHELPNELSFWEKLTKSKDVEQSWDLQQKLITKQIDRFVLEFKMKHKKGYWVDILSRAEAIFDDTGKAIRIVGTHTNITERKKNEIDLIQAKEKAEESDRLKSAFLANMSHEIRTPMNGILGFADLLKEPNLTEEQQQKFVGIIQKSGERMLNTINDIIDIAKIEAGQMDVSTSEINISEQFDILYSFFKPEAEKKGIQLQLRNPRVGENVIINSDKKKINSILINLLKNALKFSVKGTIEFGCVKKGELLEFFVTDTGKGIPKEKQQAIFDRFVQADIEAKDALQGSGLGLTISKSYVEKLGGKIWLTSKEGQGSTFYFTIPNIPDNKLNSVSNDTPAKKINGKMKKLKVLIVEDDPESEILISLLIKDFSKEILKVKNGLEAIEICKNTPDIDLILMDLRMPELDGYKATRKIREFNNDVIIIAQTAFALSGDHEKAVKAGCNDYIAKPLNKVDLKFMIKKYF